ncbi:MAG: acetate/propionate family kinase [Acidimicrobiales bacterium]
MAEPASEPRPAEGSGPILAVNVGSSSLKLSLVDSGYSTLAMREIDTSATRGSIHTRDLASHLSELGPFAASSHRIVHGGERFTSPVIVDQQVMSDLEDLVDLAPLHQRRALDVLAALISAVPNIPAIACFDTAFHATMPPGASTYALPAAWRVGLGVRRYGFHGLSYAYATMRSSEMLGHSPADLRLVIAHLGSGASLAAVAGGQSVDTTMGFTPLEGLVMATRPGNVDPGALTWLLRNGVSPADLEHGLDNECGLAGLTGSPDMRGVLAAAASGDVDARLGIEVYMHRLRALAASMVAAMGGLDALVLTGGVGERSPYVREHLARGLRFLGVEIDPALNRDATSGDFVVSPADAAVAVVIVAAREDIELARGAYELIAPG